MAYVDITPIARLLADSPIGREVDRQHAKNVAAQAASAPIVEVTPSYTFPWRTQSKDTLALQSIINAYLLPRGMCPVVVDGKLGGSTCGALKFLADSGTDASIPDECQPHASEFVAPKKNTGSCNASTKATQQSAQPAKKNESPFGLLIGAVVVGAFVLAVSRRG